MADMITVKTKETDGKVCIWEINEDHPNGEIFIKNDGEKHKVALTSEVTKRIRNGDLIEVGSKSVEPTEPEQPVEQTDETPEQPVEQTDETPEQPVEQTDETPVVEDEPAKRGRKPNK